MILRRISAQFRRALLVSTLLLVTTNVNAQESLSYDLRASTTFSFTGYGSALAFGLQHKAFQWYAGPRVVWSDAYLPLESPWGVSAGMRWFPNYPLQQRFPSFVVVDFQSARYPGACASGDCLDNTVRELSIGYGLDVPIAGKWGAYSSIHFGTYFERLNGDGSRNPIVTNNYNAMLLAGVRYHLSAP